jgi:ABC-type multidrug transport system permease subunit
MCELKSARASIPVHFIAMFQPTVMYLLMGVVLVFPTFDMNIEASSTSEDLIAAMSQVRSPNLPYINPVLIEETEQITDAQVIIIENINGQATAIQRFNLIDSNMVKNFRNRLTSAALVMWNEDLGDRAISINEHPWLPEERSYAVFFGMAMLPLTAFLAAVMIGGYATAQDFEFDTVREYRLAVKNTGLIIAARLIRLIIVGLLASMVLMLAIGITTGSWPASIARAILILVPITIIGGGLGFVVGLTLQKTLPAFVIGLTSSFAAWMLGGAFGLPAGFNRGYELISRIIPNTYAVELLFTQFYGPQINDPVYAIIALSIFCIVILALTFLTYRRQVVAQQG